MIGQETHLRAHRWLTMLMQLTQIAQLISGDKRARCARLSGLRIRIRFLAALRAAYQAHGADVGRCEQACSSLRRSSAAPLGVH